MLENKTETNKTSITPVIQPLWIFMILCVITGGLYPFLWVYRYWKFYGIENSNNVNPYWKAFSHWLFAPQFFRTVQDQASRKGVIPDYSPMLFGMVYYALFILRFFGEPFAYISILSFLPFLVVVKSWHDYLKICYSDLKIESSFLKTDWLMIILFWVLQISLVLISNLLKLKL